MKSFDTELKKYTEKVRLSVAERHELHERLLSYIEYHPLPKRKEQIQTSPGRISGSFVVLHFNTVYTRIAAGVFALLLVVGVPLLAERAVPGDVLYLVKTNFNEGIESKFANTPYEKVIFETSIIERRIAEARLLANEGKLTSDVQNQIAQTVKDHAAAVQNGLSEMKTSNPDDAAIAAISFDSTLQVQSAVLTKNDKTGTTSSTANILDAVNSARQEAATSRGTTTPSFASLFARLEQDTTRAYELFAAIKNVASSDDVSDINRRLSDINRQIIDAHESYGRSDATSSIQEMIDTLGLTQKLISFMTDIDVQKTVDLNMLVPVQLTDAERIATVQGTIAHIEASTTRVAQNLPSITDTNVLGKVTDGLKQIAALMQTATTSLATEPVDITLAEGNVTQAVVLIQDVEKIANIQSPTETTEPSTGTATGTPDVLPSHEEVPTAEQTDASSTDAIILENAQASDATN